MRKRTVLALIKESGSEHIKNLAGSLSSAMKVRRSPIKRGALRAPQTSVKERKAYML